MNDDALHPDLELASAMLDGDVSAAERARVEADPELAPLVSSLAAAREAVAAVPAAAPDVKETALAAALAEFDLLMQPGTAADGDAAAGSVAGGTVLSFFRRRSGTLMTAAAAVLLVGVIGVAVLNGGGDDGTSNSGAADAGAEAADTYSMAERSSEEMLGDEAPKSTIAGIPGPASAAVQINDGAELLAFADSLALPALQPAVPDTDAAEETEAATQATDGLVTASGDGTAGGAETMFTASPFPCALGPNQVVLADIMWVDTHAWAVRDMVTGVVTAVGDDCAVLASVAP